MIFRSPVKQVAGICWIDLDFAGREEVEKFDWRASTRQVRNEEYSAAIWFWRRRKEQLANRFSGWFKRPEPLAS